MIIMSMEVIITKILRTTIKRNNITKEKTQEAKGSQRLLHLPFPFHASFPIPASQGKQIIGDGSKEWKKRLMGSLIGMNSRRTRNKS